MESQLEIVLRLKGKHLKGTIENWAIFPYGNGETVIGDFYSVDGDCQVTDIRTSTIVEIHKEYSILETRNSYYKLGNTARNIRY